MDKRLIEAHQALYDAVPLTRGILQTPFIAAAFLCRPTLLSGVVSLILIAMAASDDHRERLGLHAQMNAETLLWRESIIRKVSTFLLPVVVAYDIYKLSPWDIAWDFFYFTYLYIACAFVRAPQPKQYFNREVAA